MSSPIFYGSTGPIGGAEIAAGGCFTGNATVTGAVVDMPVLVTPRTFPGNGSYWEGFVSAPDTVTVKLCSTLAGALPATVFDVSVFNSGGAAGGPTLETNGVPNAIQTLLNLIAGGNITLTADGAGGVTIAATGIGTGTVTHTGALTVDQPMFGNGAADSKVGTKSGNTNELASVSGALTPGNVLMSDASGNVVDGGTPPAAGTVTHTGALTLDQPVFGNGAADTKAGTKSGNTDELATVSGALTSGHVLTADASGNVVDGGAPPATGTVTHTGALTADQPMFGNGTADSKVGTKSGNTDELATVTGALTTGHLATWDASGNLLDGGAVPAGTVTHTGALTVDQPMFGNGTADSKVGTKSGNTDELATVTGAVTSGHIATWDASGNLQDGGAAPTGGPTTQQVVTGSRSLGTVFHNTTGKALYVCMSVFNTPGNQTACEAFTDAANPPTTAIAQSTSGPFAGANAVAGLTFIVLPGNFYEVTNSGTAGTALNFWTEWS
jgi:hypothetical protein